MNWILSFVGARFYDQTKQLALGPEPRHEESGPEGSGGDRRGKRKAESNDPGVATPSCNSFASPLGFSTEPLRAIHAAILDQQSLRSESRAFSTVEPWART
jgi:hypothetical protein